MRYRYFALIALFLSAAPAAFAQEQTKEATGKGQAVAEAKTTLQQQLIPESTATLIAPAQAEALREAQPAQPAFAQRRGSGTGLIIAGGALFVAGLLVGDDAGTVLAVTGAAIGAYGLYLYFQ